MLHILRCGPIIHCFDLVEIDMNAVFGQNIAKKVAWIRGAFAFNKNSPSYFEASELASVKIFLY